MRLRLQFPIPLLNERKSEGARERASPSSVDPSPDLSGIWKAAASAPSLPLMDATC